MNIIKFVLSVLVSTIFTASALAIIYFVVRDDGVIDFTGELDGKLRAIVGGGYGAVTGVVAGILISGLSISGFNLNVFTGAICGLIYNLFLPGVLILWAGGGGGWSDGITKVYYASLVIGTINGAIISLINSPQNSLK